MNKSLIAIVIAFSITGCASTAPIRSAPTNAASSRPSAEHAAERRAKKIALRTETKRLIDAGATSGKAVGDGVSKVADNEHVRHVIALLKRQQRIDDERGDEILIDVEAVESIRVLKIEPAATVSISDEHAIMGASATKLYNDGWVLPRQLRGALSLRFPNSAMGYRAYVPFKGMDPILAGALHLILFEQELADKS